MGDHAAQKGGHGTDPCEFGFWGTRSGAASFSLAVTSVALQQNGQLAFHGSVHALTLSLESQMHSEGIRDNLRRGVDCASCCQLDTSSCFACVLQDTVSRGAICWDGRVESVASSLEASLCQECFHPGLAACIWQTWPPSSRRPPLPVGWEGNTGWQ